MDYFNYRENELFAENQPVKAIAEKFGTPCYIYSRATLERHWQSFDQAFGSHPHLICYAVKANSNIAILNLLARLGSGFDIVSIGEMERVLKAGGEANKIVFPVSANARMKSGLHLKPEFAALISKWAGNSTGSINLPVKWALSPRCLFESTRMWMPRPIPIFPPG